MVVVVVVVVVVVIVVVAVAVVVVIVVVVVVVVVFVVVVALVVEVRIVKLVKLVKLSSVYFFDIFTSKKSSKPSIFYTFDFEMCFAPQQRALFRHSTSQPPKVVRILCVLYIFTWKCASRHEACTFSKLDISAPKSGPNMVCFVHFHLKMCFAPQRRALFRHLNFQKWSDHGVFCTF